MKEQAHSMEELMVQAIAEDKELKKKLTERVASAIEKTDFETILVNDIEQAFDAVFENDAIYDLIGEAIKGELKKAISKHFKGG